MAKPKASQAKSNASLAPRRAASAAKRDEDGPETSGEERAAIQAAMAEAMNIGFDEAARLAAEEQEESAEPSAEPILIGKDNKEALIGVPMLIIGYTFKEDEKYDKNGRIWAQVHALLPGNQPAVITDGSTGICAQLQAREAAGRPQRHFVPKGLRLSQYTNEHTNDGRTFYLDYSKSKEEVARLLAASKGMAAVKTQQALNRAGARN